MRNRRYCLLQTQHHVFLWNLLLASIFISSHHCWRDSPHPLSVPVCRSVQKKDPAQFLQVHGRAYKIHLDSAVALAAESPVNMWVTHCTVSFILYMCFTVEQKTDTERFCCSPQDALARGHQQHDWQVWCASTLRLHPHLHTFTLEQQVSLSSQFQAQALFLYKGWIVLFCFSVISAE